MKSVLIGLFSLVLLAVVVIVVGALLPQRHTVSRSARFKASQQRLFALVAENQQWRPDVKYCESYSKDGHQFQSETSSGGETILYELSSVVPPHGIQRRIASTNLPYGGSWLIHLDPDTTGPEPLTRVRVTEDGEVYNPIFRFVSRFLIGHTRTIDGYLQAMASAVNEKVQIED